MSAVGQAAVGAAGGPLSKSARDLACGDDFLEGRLCARKESLAGFGQATLRVVRMQQARH
jgi:hypothetical protein